MNIKSAKAFAQQKIKEGYKSDGCTLSPDLDFVECCEMHDMIIRFNYCSRKDADVLLKKYIREKKRNKLWKFIFKPISYLYYISVRLHDNGLNMIGIKYRVLGD